MLTQRQKRLTQPSIVHFFSNRGAVDSNRNPATPPQTTARKQRRTKRWQRRHQHPTKSLSLVALSTLGVHFDLFDAYKLLLDCFVTIINYLPMALVNIVNMVSEESPRSFDEIIYRRAFFPHTRHFSFCCFRLLWTIPAILPILFNLKLPLNVYKNWKKVRKKEFLLMLLLLRK